MPERPLVTLCLPTYNGAATVARALDALIAQDYPNIELLIADDASTDETPAICEDYARRCVHVHFERNARNLGSSDNFLKLLRKARGEYCVWVSQDDVWHPHFVSTLASILDAHPEAVAAQSATRYFWEDTGEEAFTVHLAREDWPQNQGYLKAAISILTKRGASGELIKNNTLMHGVLRRDVFSAIVERFPGGIFSTERQILCHLALAGRIFFVDEVLFMKQMRRMPRALLYPDDPISRLSGRRFEVLRRIIATAESVAHSPVVPFHRKLYLPIIVVEYLRTKVALRFVHRCAQWVRDHGPAPVYKALKRLKG